MKFLCLKPRILRAKGDSSILTPYSRFTKSFVCRSWFYFFLFFATNQGVSQTINQYDLLITELMSDPNPTVGLPNEEYLEIYNNSQNPIELRSVKITIGNNSFQPDSLSLEPDSFIVFMDADIPTLKNSGDSIIILFNSQVIHRVNYSPSMHESTFKENGGWSLELIDFSKPCLTEKNWTSSQNTQGGTPGFKNSNQQEISPPPVELISYFPKNDSQLTIIFNRAINDVESENESIVLNNTATIAIPLLDSNTIDSVFISSISTCYENNFKSRYLKYGIPQPPDSGEAIISEILFNPNTEGSDFIELYNNSKYPVDLSLLSFSKLNENSELDQGYPISETPLLLLPNEYIVVCPDEGWLKQTFPKSKNIIESKVPSMNNDDGHICINNKAGVILDELKYAESWHYAELNDNENISLEKINLLGFNNSTNWTSAATSTGYATPGYQNSNFHIQNHEHKNFSLPYNVVTPNSDGYHDQLIINYNFENVSWTGQISVLGYSGITIHDLSSNQLFGKNGTVIWDGKLENGIYVKAGIYVVYINGFNLENQNKLRQKITFYINGSMQ